MRIKFFTTSIILGTLLVISTGCTSMAGMGTDASAMNGTRGSKTALMTEAQSRNYDTQRYNARGEVDLAVHKSEANRKIRNNDISTIADTGNGIRDGVNSAKEVVYSIKDFFSSFRR